MAGSDAPDGNEFLPAKPKKRARGLIAGSVICGLFALGTVPQFGTTDTGAEFIVFAVFAALSVALGSHASRVRRQHP